MAGLPGIRQDRRMPTVGDNVYQSTNNSKATAIVDLYFELRSCKQTTELNMNAIHKNR
jgi:hypothetical protein